MITWDPNDKNAGGTLSDDLLTFSNPNAVSTIRATHPIINSKVYFELKLNNLKDYWLIGIANKNYLFDNPVNNSNLRGIRLDGRLYPESTQTYFKNWTDKDIIGAKIDKINNTLEFYRNGISVGISHNSISTLGEEIYPFLRWASTENMTSTSITANFGATEFDIVTSNPEEWNRLRSEGYLPYDIENASWFINFLIKYNNKIQTLSKSNELIDTGLNEPLTQTDFMTYGIHDLSVIPKEKWTELGSNFEILTWTGAIKIPQLELTIPEIRPYRLLDNPSMVTYTEGEKVPILSQTVMVESKIRFLVSKDKANYQVYKNNNWTTIDKSNILEQGMTKIELESIPQEVWAEWFENEAHKNTFDILVGMYSENPNKPLIRSITVNYAENEAPIVIDAHIEPDTIHNEFATIKANVKDYEGDKISFKVLIKKAGISEFVQASPVEGWYNRATSEEEITQAFNFPYFNPGENDIKLVVKDERGAEAEWVGKIILSNTDPIISLTYDDFIMKATIGDDDGDDIAYRISVNGELIFDYTDFTPTKTFVNYVFAEHLKFGEENTIKLEVKDTHGGYASQEFTVIGTYRGLMFKNENGEYFVDDNGEILMDLLFDKTLIGGQTSETKKVTLENRHEFPLTNVKIEPENPNFVDGAVLEISETEMPFNPKSIIQILEIMPILGEKDFYVRVKTNRDAHEGGYFYIKSTASPIVK